MNIVLLQSRLSDEEIRELTNEFPNFLFLSPGDQSYQRINPDEWGRVEILYGNRLAAENLEKAHLLRWIHSPNTNLNPLCLNEIQKQGNILLTTTREENFAQIGEYVIGGILSFAKNLFHWEKAHLHPTTLWDSKWRDAMWTLKDKILIQVGLGNVGTEIARRAKQMDMKVWGVAQKSSFHPHCNKVFSIDELHSILHAGDVVSIALPRMMQKTTMFKSKEINLMKKDSIFVLVGELSTIDEETLAENGKEGKFRGILIDAKYQTPPHPSSKLWEIPHLILTPEVSPRPRHEEKEAYRLFRYNLRQYLYGNFTDMRNRTEYAHFS